TYNIFREHLSRFFKWLYYPDLDYQLRKQAVKPAVITNIPQLKRKEISNYEPTDLWTTEEELLFLKYCPSKRDKCYHAVSRDTSARPIEILRLKRRDVKFKEIGTSQYAEVTLKGRKGKEGQRTVPLIDSLPYLKDYLLNEHPMPSNPDAPLISSTGKSLGRHLRTKRIWDIYDNHKKKTFPGLLQSPDVSPEDKQKIVELLKKPWNPYIRRHTALTAKSKILRDNVFKQHAGWTKNSQMQIKYLHYFGNESSESLLEAYGLVDHGVQLDQLRPKQCPNCNESCKVDDKFCPKCMMVLSYDSYNEVIDKQRQFESDMKEVHDILSEIKDLKKKLKKD
ncbi:MAG TPA: site-specific integrase, partial [Nitrososphaeraceae archaeon]|nr:site-specific integrase [Nitrososphaeraceae archaeon]